MEEHPLGPAILESWSAELSGVHMCVTEGSSWVTVVSGHKHWMMILWLMTASACC